MNTPALSIPNLPDLAAAPVSQRHLAEAWRLDLEARVAAGQLSARTARDSVATVRDWLAWLDRCAVLVPTPAHVLAYVAELRVRRQERNLDCGLKPGSISTYLSRIRSFYTWAETRNAFPAIARSIRGLSIRKDEPLDCLDRAQVAGLLGLVEGYNLAALRDRALVHVLFCTALRLVSLTGADVADLDLVAGELTYRGKGDTDKTRRAYLSPSALAAVSDYLKARRALAPLPGTAPLFAAVGNRAGGGRLTDRSVRRVLVGLMERAGHVRRGADGLLVRPGILSAHSLRRSGITAAFDAAGLDAAQSLAGHADPKTTLKAYARVNRGRMLKGLAVSLDLGAAV